MVATELLLILVTERRQFAGVWEVETGVLWILPAALSAAAPVGLLGAGLLALTERSAARAPRSILCALVGLFSAGVAWGVGGGRHLADPSTRGGFAALVGLVAALAAFGLAPRLAAQLKRRPGLIAFGALISIVLLELVNRLVLVRLYPAFHWALALLTLLVAPVVAWGWIHPVRRSKLRSAISLGLSLLLPALLVFPTAPRLARLDNFRFVLIERAPVLGRVLELSARIAPPDPGSPGDPCAPGQSCRETPAEEAAGPTLDLTGRDVLLISIDALRADHVGTYGYARPTTPNLDRLARQGAVFEQAYTATPHTSYALVSLMTGKYMRPLLLQGAGADSDTWASILRTYGYRTAGFFPPAVFFIDPARFEPFQKNSLGFEYVKVEFAEGEARIRQVKDYLTNAPPQPPLFVWVHLFGPHEPYVAHPAHPFGERDIDRYDSEIAAADVTLGAIVERFRASRPNAAVIVTADHGEEFGEHGGRYHGTTVYEEQLRVPLILSVPGAVGPRRIREVVSTVDLLPTVLGALAIPRPPRLRGRDLGPLLIGRRPEQAGIAYGETEEHVLLARGTERLVCLRRIGACKLYDLLEDPGQTVDLGSTRPAQLEALRAELRAWSASHGRYESQGLRADGKAWPAPIVRGLAGDGEVASEVAALLDDVEVGIRRKAAEVLVELRRPEVAPALRLALGRDEDTEVQKLCALALTRLGEGAPLVLELLNDSRYRRLASLALGEAGDPRGLPGLLDWWRDKPSRDFARSKEILSALANLRAEQAVVPLITELDDVRLRPEIAATLAQIGEKSARGPLARALSQERSVSARAALFRALIELGARYELASPLVRFLGVPDPLSGGLSIALEARILKHVGGPSDRELERLREFSALGTRVRVVVPRGGNGTGVRALVRVECPRSMERGELLLGSAEHLVRYDKKGKLIPQRKLPELDSTRALRLTVPCSGEPLELFATLPESVPARPASTTEVIVFASRGIRVHALALVPLADELPPPAPKPWKGEEPMLSEERTLDEEVPGSP